MPTNLLLSVSLALMSYCVGSSVHADTIADSAGDKPALSREDTEKLAIADLAKRQNVRSESIKVAESAEHTWPDELLGCWNRRMREPKPVQGYLIVLDISGTRHIYHTDRHGRMARCVTPKKGLSPIMR
jgi:hypothetical protein